ncbi:MAG: 50S ribosomal protein L5 [Anaerolineales bacterium]|nr:50S ribosomal protein L5 [Anaerolineales bacterium]
MADKKAEKKVETKVEPKAETPAETKVETKAEPRPVPRLKTRYNEELVVAMMKEFNYRNVMEVPRIKKISVNIGLGEALQNSKALEAAAGDMAIMTGQKAVITKAKKSIATYKLREGMPIGVKVTLRGARMWDFLDRLINVVLPRQRDFQGVSTDAFDGRGNYSLGLREQLVFPEINYDKVDKIRGMEVTIVTSAKSDEEARRLLALMNMPFKR